MFVKRYRQKKRRGPINKVKARRQADVYFFTAFFMGSGVLTVRGIELIMEIAASLKNAFLNLIQKFDIWFDGVIVLLFLFHKKAVNVSYK